jgi:hypothetical protein
MKIVDRATVVQNMGDTKTVQTFGTVLGQKPHKLGVVATMYPQLSITTLTDALKNVYYNPKKSEGSFAPVNSMAIEWEIEVNFIKEVKVVSAISGNGLNKNVETIVLAERYYEKNDTFRLENNQLLFVVAPPKQLSNSAFSYKVILVGNDRAKSIDTAFASAGRKTRYISNYHAELSERGYTKAISNSELHRNFISRQRASTSWSSDFAVNEEIYLEMTKGKDKTCEYYKMNKKEKECMDHFMLSREQNNIFSETNYDINGKCLDQDEMGRDIPMGDGAVPQIERYCDKFFFSIMSSDILDDVIATMNRKSDNVIGNTYAVICNESLYQIFGKVMKTDLRFQSPNDGSYFYSKKSGGEIHVGAHFKSYEVQGNTLTFMPNRALSQHYPDYPYGIFLDTTADLTNGRPNVAMFTLQGCEVIEGSIRGLGGLDGKSSGEISTSVAGSSYHIMGYSGIVVFNPYKSFILAQSRTF